MHSQAVLKDLRREETDFEKQKHLSYLQKQNQELRSLYEMKKKQTQLQVQQAPNGMLQPEIIHQANAQAQAAMAHSAQQSELKYNKYQKLRDLSDQGHQPRNNLQAEIDEMRQYKHKQRGNIETQAKHSKRSKKAEAHGEDVHSSKNSRNKLIKSSGNVTG